MKLVITEKPSVAMSLAKVAGAVSRRTGYMEGNGYRVSWCVGHLVAFYDAQDYEERYGKWRFEDLPIIPQEWGMKVMERTRKQFERLKDLMDREDTEELVCATDAGREGELIFRLVYQMAECRKPFRRLWLSSMEETAVKEAFAGLKDGSAYDDLYRSALCRAQADWLVGINASRLFSVLYNHTLNVGRVQTPALAMIVERGQEIAEFQKEAFYVVHLKNPSMEAVSERVYTKEEAERIAADCHNRMCQVEEVKEEKGQRNPPRLYDLTSLQRDANRLFGYTAGQTLDIAQALYEQKLITYPRTESRYLTDDMEKAASHLTRTLLQTVPFAEGHTYDPELSRVLCSAKVTDHPALLPTEEIAVFDPGEHTEQEKNILYLIAGRLLMATGKPYLYKTAKYALTCNYHTFYIDTFSVLDPGYREIERELYEHLGLAFEEEERVPEGRIYLGQVFGYCTASISEHFTRPPKHYTEDTLLAAMEKAGSGEAAGETSRKGLGTAGTRAGIIEKLVGCGYIKREGRNLVPTEDGISLIAVIPAELKTPEMTAEWEMQLDQIANGTKNADAFRQGIEALVRELVNQYHFAIPVEGVRFTRGRTRVGTCPRCGNPVYEGKSNYYCSDRECRFVLWKNDHYLEKLGTHMTRQAAEEFLENGKIHCSGLKSARTGNPYEADIVLEVADDGKASYLLLFPDKG